MYADVIVDISAESLDKTYQYLVPSDFEDVIAVGLPVAIPFGKRQISGYVVGLSETAKFDPAKTKPIISIEQGKFSIEGRMIALAYWIKEQFGSTMNDALHTVLPVKKTVKEKVDKSIVPVDRNRIRDAYQVALTKKHHAKARLLAELLDADEIAYELITGKLNVSPAVIKKFEADGLIKINTVRKYRSPIHGGESVWKKPVLNEAQQSVADEIKDDLKNGIRRNYLIHGVTGSGKTEVYMDVIEEVIREGKQVIMLIPEIALTYQTVKRFYLRFGDRISIINSKLSAGERFDQCERAKRGEVDIMIGPRSALFTPFQNLGLIIIDEEHESSYKSEASPRYHAREVAYKLGELEGASVILGSATPSLEAYAAAEAGRLKLFTLKERAGAGTPPSIDVVDMREELKAKNRSIFSRRLQEQMADRLNRGEQIMLFLNRRGYSGSITCRSCGKPIACPHCDVSMTLHKGYSPRILCHICGYSEPAPDKCPSCGSPYIGSFGIGTEKIEEQLRNLYPSARILRMDADTTKEKDSYEKILQTFANGEADILVGTQMIVKGHDFHRVTLVGILMADMSLNTNDYRAAERTYQLLAQAAGRAGRGNLPGAVVIQTYNPSHYAIVRASRDDYEGFYAEEMDFRKLMKYPPSAQMLQILVQSPNEAKAVSAAEQTKAMIKSLDVEGIKIVGPAPASIARINDIYRQVLYLKSTDYRQLVEIKDQITAKAVGSSFIDVNLQFDFNPMSP